MRVEGTAKVADFLGDSIVYRRLEPADRQLPGLTFLAGELGLASNIPPRKSDRDYARVIVGMLQAAQASRQAAKSLRQLIYIGDSPTLDLQAFANLRAVSGWDSWAFIGKDDMSQESTLSIDGTVCYSTRWANLPHFLKLVRDKGIELDSTCAVVVDLDKTLLGPRGRNDRVIDAARAEAAVQVADRVLTSEQSRAKFAEIYREMNQPKYHFFTEDNQDYLVYCALMLAAGVYGFDGLQKALSDHTVSSFGDFLSLTEREMTDATSRDLQRIHREVMENSQLDDPTPFKSFRRQEYLTTTGRMSPSEDGRSLEKILKEHITINYELVQALDYLKRADALLLGLSDKPDEAVFPTPALQAEGHLPLHHVTAFLVGESLAWPM